MASTSMNRIEILFRTTIDKMRWVAGHIRAPKDGIQSHGVSFTDPVMDVLGEATILNIEEGDVGSLVVYFEASRAASCWFTSMVKTDSAIEVATMEYSDANNLVIGTMNWTQSRKTITDEFRLGPELTEDDFHILGRFRCSHCNEFLCVC
jgi:hypothetical protein